MSLKFRVCKNIQKVRREKKVSHAELSKRTGMAEKSISRLENETSNLTLDTVEKIANALGVEIGELTGSPAPDATEEVKAGVQYCIDLLNQVEFKN